MYVNHLVCLTTKKLWLRSMSSPLLTFPEIFHVFDFFCIALFESNIETEHKEIAFSIFFSSYCYN